MDDRMRIFMQQLLVMNDDEIYQSIYTRISERGEV